MALFLLLAGVCLAQDRDREFARLADRFFDEVVFTYDPVQGTQAGFHQYDSELPSGSPRRDRSARPRRCTSSNRKSTGFGARRPYRLG